MSTKKYSQILHQTTIRKSVNRSIAFVEKIEFTSRSFSAHQTIDTVLKNRNAPGKRSTENAYGIKL